jgi:hypothetical protein
MDDRIHLSIDGDEKKRLRELASRKGVSLSEWMRQAAAERAAAERAADLPAEGPPPSGSQNGDAPRRVTGSRADRRARGEIIERLMGDDPDPPAGPDWLPDFARRLWGRHAHRDRSRARDR